MSDDKNSKDVSVDAELNELLDNALEDFDKPPKTTNAASKAEGQADSSTPQTSANDVPDELVDETWPQDFIKQAADQFEKNLQNLMNNGVEGDLGASLQKMAQSVASAIGTNPSGSDSDSPDFQAAIAQALKDLSATTENLQNAGSGLTEADLAAMFGQASLEDGSNDILPFMHGMIQSLLSKEVLYPSLKELVDKYPAWLEEKKTTLPPDDLEKYNKQLELMQKVCTELENENETDSEEVKKQRFDTILALMQEMQNYGQPPEELVGDQQSAFFQVDADGNPVMPPLPAGVESPQNCNIM
ncbi:peroxisomal biogenesis factor 19 isoform X1 [Venturia canescens]|uniref:peroxisomal biogenesis factor 19 isoform X1 n=1 Tax=Venturia canescens TaxID=32260 RepID=UPI001C9CDE47|nr:peroxisomal biogenesis factor 19 isoform X1 [Venturia canescens]